MNLTFCSFHCEANFFFLANTRDCEGHAIINHMAKKGRFCPQSLQQVGLMQHGTHAFEVPACCGASAVVGHLSVPTLEKIR